MTKRIAILGSTGSIGKNTLEIVQAFREEIQVTALTVRSNIELLEKQVKQFRPEIVAVYDKEKAHLLKQRLTGVKVVAGLEGLEEVASFSNVDFVLCALNGAEAILPVVKAIQAKKQIGLATKEVLVAAGPYIMQCARENGVSILPIDSELSAIFQCLEGKKKDDVHSLILTASGGPFYNYKVEELAHIGVKEALLHPNYSMGAKVTVDSSTLMNKGLEVIEAHYLFCIPLDKIQVVVHPQQVIHGCVEFIDGAVLAQMSDPDMKIPIQYALTFPQKKPSPAPAFRFAKYPTFNFFLPDKEKFSCLDLAYQAAREGGTVPCYMNAANEVLVHRFLEGKIGWLDIGKKLERLMQLHNPERELHLERLLMVDADARNAAARE